MNHSVLHRYRVALILVSLLLVAVIALHGRQSFQAASQDQFEDAMGYTFAGCDPYHESWFTFATRVGSRFFLLRALETPNGYLEMKPCANPRTVPSRETQQVRLGLIAA